MFKPDTVTEILHWHDIMILFILVLLVYIRKGSSTASTADKSEKQCNCCWLMLPLWWMSVYWYYYSSFDWRDYSFFLFFYLMGLSSQEQFAARLKTDRIYIVRHLKYHFLLFGSRLDEAWQRAVRLSGPSRSQTWDQKRML